MLNCFCLFSFFKVKTFSHISLPNCEVLLIMKVFLQKETRVWLQNCRQTDNKIERCKPTHLRLNWAKKGAKRNLSKPIVWISVCALNQLVIEKVAFDLIAPSRQQWPRVQYIFSDSKLLVTIYLWWVRIEHTRPPSRVTDFFSLSLAWLGKFLLGPIITIYL